MSSSASSLASNIIDLISKGMYNYKEFFITLTAIFSWLSFAVLNRPVGEEKDMYFNVIWWSNLVMAAINTLMFALVLIKFIRI